MLSSYFCTPAVIPRTASDLTLMLQHSLYHLDFSWLLMPIQFRWFDKEMKCKLISVSPRHPTFNSPFLEIVRFKSGTWNKASQNSEKELSYSLILAQSLPWPMHDAHLKYQLLQHDSPWERTRLCTTQPQSFRYQREHKYSSVTETPGNQVIRQAVARWCGTWRRLGAAAGLQNSEETSSSKSPLLKSQFGCSGIDGPELILFQEGWVAENTAQRASKWSPHSSSQPHQNQGGRKELLLLNCHPCRSCRQILPLNFLPASLLWTGQEAVGGGNPAAVELLVDWLTAKGSPPASDTFTFSSFVISLVLSLTRHNRTARLWGTPLSSLGPLQLQS